MSTCHNLVESETTSSEFYAEITIDASQVQFAVQPDGNTEDPEVVKVPENIWMEITFQSPTDAARKITLWISGGYPDPEQYGDVSVDESPVPGNTYSRFYVYKRGTVFDGSIVTFRMELTATHVYVYKLVDGEKELVVHSPRPDHDYSGAVITAQAWDTNEVWDFPVICGVYTGPLVEPVESSGEPETKKWNATLTWLIVAAVAGLLLLAGTGTLVGSILGKKKAIGN
jgi:hypothetical protein